MKKNLKPKLKSIFTNAFFLSCIGSILVLFVLFSSFPKFFGFGISYHLGQAEKLLQKNKNVLPALDIVAYDNKLAELVNNPIPKPSTKIVSNVKTGEKTTVVIQPEPVKSIWPVKTVYPNAGAILPFNRIIAYYGNLYSTKMGVLGEYPEAIMTAKLKAEVKKWTEADPSTPAIPALHYIAVVAQSGPREDGKYRARMPDSEIDKVLKMAEKINALVFIDFQVGFSTLQSEIPHFEKYLKMPNVHLGVDPEFSMKNGIRPGKVVGTFDAVDINYAANYLAKLVKENNLPPKILIVHRYTQKMLTNYNLIKPLPEVQIIVHMDGWGGVAKKLGTYRNFIYPEPVQFTGFKIFYKNDILTPGSALMTPADVLKLNPKPIYIQYQ
ncbi:MAG: hypothetical protein Q7K54_02860 [Candidatus Parcubacteria bacterium]|nr:hypothetical protein [Candidatus Parcubacteria bacterium]